MEKASNVLNLLKKKIAASYGPTFFPTAMMSIPFVKTSP
jgi:hypothetical protein